MLPLLLLPLLLLLELDPELGLPPLPQPFPLLLLPLSFELEPEAEPKPEPDPEPDPEMEPESDPCLSPESQLEPEPVTEAAVELEPEAPWAVFHAFHAASALPVADAPTYRTDLVMVVVPRMVEVMVLVEVTVFPAVQPAGMLVTGAPVVLTVSQSTHWGSTETSAALLEIGTVTVAW